jgi:hypothetical protein
MKETDIAALIRQFKRRHGRELCARYGAHGIGIGWKRVGGKKTETLALIFYVAKKRDVEELGDEAIPPTLTFQPEEGAEAVTIATDVVETEPAQFE